MEREVYDMFGIYFINHSDLRILLTDYNSHAHPLKKNFPLSGYIDIKYSAKKEIQYIPIKFSQIYRLMVFTLRLF